MCDEHRHTIAARAMAFFLPVGGAGGEGGLHVQFISIRAKVCAARPKPDSTLHKRASARCLIRSHASL